LDLITYALLRKHGGGGGGSSIFNGYYNSADGKFYEDSAYTIPMVGKEDELYISDDTNKLYRFDGTNFIVLAEGSGSIQVKVLPAASAAELGNIYQYIGSSTLQYKNGCFYKCVNGTTPGTYEWSAVNVEDPTTYEDDPIDFDDW